MHEQRPTTAKPPWNGRYQNTTVCMCVQGCISRVDRKTVASQMVVFSQYLIMKALWRLQNFFL